MNFYEQERDIKMDLHMNCRYGIKGKMRSKKYFNGASMVDDC